MTGGRLAAWVLIALGITYALFIGGEPAGVQLAQVRVISALVIGVALGTWGFVATRDPSWRPRSVFMPALAACVLSMTLSTVTSRSPRISVEYLAYAVLWAALYLLLVQLLRRPAFRTRILGLASLAGYLIALLFLAAVLVIWVRFWSDLERVTVPPLRPDFETLVFGNPSVVLVIVTLLGAIAVGWMSEFHARSRALLVGSAILFGATALVTGARGGWFAIGVGVVASGVAVVYATGFSAFARFLRDVARRRGRAQLIGLGVVISVAVAALAPAILRRLSTSEGNRTTFFDIALRLFSEQPLVGVGPGIWAVSRLPYTPSTGVDEYVPHAHDLYLQGLSEMGLVGLVAGVVATLTVLWLIRDGLRDADPSRRRWAVVAAFTSAYFFSHQLVDFFANAPATFLAFAIPIALLDASRTNHPRLLPERTFGLRSRFGGVALGLGAAAALTAAIAVEIPALIHADAVAKANRGDWVSARGPADLAASIDPEMPIYRLTAGLAAARAGDYAAAADDLRVIAEAGDLPEAWLDLADAYVHLDRRDLASGALDRALRLGRQQVLVAVASVQLALQLGDRQRAVAAAVNALRLSPSLVGDPWWASDPERSAVLRDAGQIASSSDAIGWQLALYAGRLDEARGAAAELPAPDASIPNLVIAAWGGELDAYETLIDRCLADPYGPALGWCVAIAIEHEATSDIRRLLSIAAAAGVHDLHTRYRLVEDPTRPAIAGNNAILYGIHAYRRFTPWDMLSPGLVRLTLE